MIFFRIDASYAEVVGNKVEEFENHLHIQLAAVIGTKLENIINLKTWPGSIEVSCQQLLAVIETQLENIINLKIWPGSIELSCQQFLAVIGIKLENIIILRHGQEILK